MAQTTFIADAAALSALEELKSAFGVSTNSAVIRKALTLAKFAAQMAGDNHTITILDEKNNEKTKVIINA